MSRSGEHYPGRAHRVLDAIIGNILQAGVAFVLPFLATGAALWSSRAQHFDFAVTTVVAASVFFFVSVGSYFLSRMIEENSPKGKLYVTQPVFGRDQADEGGKKRTTKVQLSVRLSNIAKFPIYYRVEHLSTDVGGKINNDPKLLSRGGVVAPGNTNDMRDDVIDVTDLSLGDTYQGRIRIRLRYGREGRLWFRLVHSDSVKITEGSDGGLSYNWTTIDL